MDNLAKPTNRALFLVSVAVTGALAGAAVWLFFFAMEHGIDYLWTEVPHMLGVSSPELASGPFGFLPYPFFVCLLGGLVIGLYEKMTGAKTDDLNQVMTKVKQTVATRTTIWASCRLRRCCRCCLAEVLDRRPA